MSVYYICDLCKNNAIEVFLDTVHCRARHMEHVPKVAGGHADPRELCPDFERRDDRLGER